MSEPAADDGGIRRTTWIVLALLTALGLAVRAYHVGERVPWIDEVDTRLYAEGSFLGPIHAAFAGPPVSNPPLYFMLLNALTRLHLSGAHHRPLSVLLGTAAIPVIFLLGRRLHSARAGLFAAALIALSPLHVLYSREARGYTLLVLATILLLLGAIGVAERDRRQDRVLFVGGGALVALSHHAGVPLVVVVALWTLWMRRTWKTFWLCAALALAAIPTLAQVLLQSRDTAKLMPHTGPALAGSFDRFKWGLVNELGVGNLQRHRDALALTIAGWLLGLFFLLRRKPKIVVLLVAASCLPIALMAFPESAYEYVARYAIHALPMSCAVVGVGLASLGERRRIPLIGGAAALAVLAVWLWLGSGPLQREMHAIGTPYDHLGALITEFGEPHQRVFVIGPEEPASYRGPMSVGALQPYLPADFQIEFRSTWAPDFSAFDPTTSFVVSGYNNYPSMPSGPSVVLFVPEQTELENETLGRAPARNKLIVHPPTAFDRARRRAFFERARERLPGSWMVNE